MNPLAREHLPNSLTLLRLVLAAGFFAVIGPYRFGPGAAAWPVDVAVALFVIAATTDALDGFLARRWNVVSPFGRIMDPFCDKVLVLGAFVMLAGPRFALPGEDGGPGPGATATGIAPWMVVVVLARELLVTTARGYLESRGISFAAMAAGKWKMILQSVAVPVVLVLAARPVAAGHDWALWANRAIAWAVVAVTVWSGIPYAAAILRLVRAGETGTHEPGAAPAMPAPSAPPRPDAESPADREPRDPSGAADR